VGRPSIKRKDASLFISIPVEEGPVYGVGEVTIGKAPFKDKEKRLSELKIRKQKVFNREVLRQDIIKLTDACADLGYAYCDITPKVKKDAANRLVNVELLVDEGPLVTFNKIEIVGNTITRDKVIRRELRVSELEPFSATGLKKSKNRLKRLGYFEDVSLNPTKGETKDTMNLEVQVKERPTGSFSIGAGYSSVDKFILMGDITKRNFLGKGQTLSFKGILGSRTNRFAFSFIEPYLWDTRLTAGADIYSWEREYDDYTKDSKGLAVNFAYPLFENMKILWGARIDNTNLKDVADDASWIIKESVDIRTTRALNIGLKHDSRNDYYMPTKGWVNDLNVEYAGGYLGGDSAFIKFQGTTSYYHTLFWKLVGHVRGGLGYVTEGSDGKLPVYEKFYLGGIDSIRGFKYAHVSPIDPETGDRIGGDYMAFAQVETIFPLVKDMGLNGVVFFDTGNVWSDDIGSGFSDLRKSVGLGVRWLSPMGPLRIEWGYNLDPRDDEDSSNWDFRMGGSF
jgi:outer membrane protein insertion porin family